MKFHLAFLMLPLLAACGSGAGYPSLQQRAAETPRAIAAADASAAAPTLAADDRAGIERELGELGPAFDRARHQLQGVEADLQRALAVPGASSTSSAAWSDAQILVSEYQDVRSEIGAAEVQLAALAIRVEGVAADDPTVARLTALQQQVRDSLARSAGRLAAANARLGN